MKSLRLSDDFLHMKYLSSICKKEDGEQNELQMHIYMLRA